MNLHNDANAFGVLLNDIHKKLGIDLMSLKKIIM